MKNKDPLIRSDNLPEARSLLNLFDQDSINLMDLGQQVPIIIDASILIKDIRYQVKNNVRTGIIEAIDAGTVKPIAPDIARNEVERDLQKISEREQLDREDLFSVWDDVRAQISFHEVQKEVESNDTAELTHHNDLCYLFLQIMMGYPILTKDNDFDEVDGETIPISIRKPLRDYSRNEPYRIYTVIGSGVIFSGVSGIVKGGFKAAKSGIGFLRNTPPWILVIVGIAGFTFFSNKNVREKLLNAGRNIMSELKAIVQKAGPKVGKGVSHILEKTREAERNLNEIEQKIGKNHRR